MEIATDLMASLRNRLGAGVDSAVPAGLEWPGLLARLTAAHAARTALADVVAPTAAAIGGFSNWSASTAPVTENPFRAVNLTVSTDGKAPADIEEIVAPQSLAGGRGQ